MPKQKRDKTITICLNVNDLKLLEGASKLLSRPLSIFIRSSAVENARKELLNSGIPLDILIEKYGFSPKEIYKKINSEVKPKG